MVYTTHTLILCVDLPLPPSPSSMVWFALLSRYLRSITLFGFQQLGRLGSCMGADIVFIAGRTSFAWVAVLTRVLSSRYAPSISSLAFSQQQPRQSLVVPLSLADSLLSSGDFAVLTSCYTDSSILVECCARPCEDFTGRQCPHHGE
jgi:hypothetical protein